MNHCDVSLLKLRSLKNTRAHVKILEISTVSNYQIKIVKISFPKLLCWQSLELKCLETRPKSLFYLFVHVYANVALSHLLKTLYFRSNETLSQQQRFNRAV